MCVLCIFDRGDDPALSEPYKAIFCEQAHISASEENKTLYNGKQMELRAPYRRRKAYKKRLAETLSISPAICTLLVQRGLKTEEQVKKFFRPQLSDLYDPFLLKDMDKAVARLNQAMGAKEKILIYGDYDVDGTTAVALVYKFLNNFYSNIDYYIPDRYDEGYGISIKGIDYAADNGFSLVIALDCGIKAVEKVAYAKERGVEFIICDHHVPDDELPKAVAVLDAKREDDTYPYHHLSGCGVGFKFMQGFAASNNISVEQFLYPLLDMVAVSIGIGYRADYRRESHFGLSWPPQAEFQSQPWLARNY